MDTNCAGNDAQTFGSRADHPALAATPTSQDKCEENSTDKKSGEKTKPQEPLSLRSPRNSYPVLRIKTENDVRNALVQAACSRDQPRSKAAPSALHFTMSAPASSSQGTFAGASNMQHVGRANPIEAQAQGRLKGTAKKWWDVGAPKAAKDQGDSGSLSTTIDRDLQALSSGNNKTKAIMEVLALPF